MWGGDDSLRPKIAHVDLFKMLQEEFAYLTRLLEDGESKESVTKGVKKAANAVMPLISFVQIEGTVKIQDWLEVLNIPLQCTLQQMRSRGTFYPIGSVD